MENNATISEKNPAILEQNDNNKKLNPIFSVPLFKQSLKSNWVLWLVLTLASALIFLIINFAVGTKQIFTSINMDKVSAYVRDENLDWLKIFGLFLRKMLQSKWPEYKLKYIQNCIVKRIFLSFFSCNIPQFLLLLHL